MVKGDKGGNQMVWKTVIALLLFSCAFSLCSIDESIQRMSPMPGVVYGNEYPMDGDVSLGEAVWTKPPAVKTKVPTALITEYTVVAGDTLGQIAIRYGTTWEKLWELNRDRISDPNLIHIGQRIRITGKVIPVIPPMTREEKIDKLARFMFKTANLKYETRDTLEDRLLMYQKSLVHFGFSSMSNQRFILGHLQITTRQYEIWQLAEAIIDASKDDETLYKLVGLAWQESHFVNQRGKHGEVSFFQFLPSTVKGRFQLDDIGLVRALWDLENDPKIATVLALDMMTENNWSGLRWNGGTEFTFHWNNKIYWFKSEWRKR